MMNDNDLVMLYDIVKDLKLTDDKEILVGRLGVIVEQINLSHEYRDKLTALQNKLQGVDADAKN